jgi:hypothetical protein
MVLTASSALSLVTGLVCHHRRRDAKHHRQLDASVGASGPHGFAVRKISAFVNALLASTASRPTSVTIAKRPSWRNGTARDMQVIWVKWERKYFCAQDWTGRSRLNCFSKSSCARGHSSSGSGYCSGASPTALRSLGYLAAGSLRFRPIVSIRNCQSSP